jgi:hypothetical protein
VKENDMYLIHGDLDEDFEPKIENEITALDNRQYYVGRVLVKADRNGPYEFRLNGVEVPCTCDPEQRLVCQYHLTR